MGQDEPETDEKHGLKERITGLGQKIIGEAEIIGGALTGDPTTQAEGEFNVEVGEIRKELAKTDDEADQ